MADVKETQAGQFNAVDNLSQRLENTQAATEGLFARNLPAEVGTEREADPVGSVVDGWIDLCQRHHTAGDRTADEQCAAGRSDVGADSGNRRHQQSRVTCNLIEASAASLVC